MNVGSFFAAALLAGWLLALRTNVFFVVLIAPIAGLVWYFLAGGAWASVAMFLAIQLGYVGSVGWSAAVRRTRHRALERTAAEADREVKRAKLPAESL